ncbi:MAG: NAD(P)H-hydrate dehydratase [Oscillospiraceae bacterium]|nr:NAD(P)H-hydrate dehydratase [Oscillospiraceae bacterium]
MVCASPEQIKKRELSEEKVIASLPKRKVDSHKGNYGKLLNIAGCKRMSGAAALSTLAALRSGAGLVRLASVESVIERLASSIYEAVYLPLSADKSGAIAAENVVQILSAAEQATAVSIGCGLSVTGGVAVIVKEIIKNIECPIILDADGINCLADNIDIIKNARSNLIITPHEAELTRLARALGIESGLGRYGTAVMLAQKYGIIVVAKGVPTIITGEGFAEVCHAGNPGLSKGGSGDVLTGIIASLAAQGMKPLEAASAGVLIHGLAADRAAERLSQAGMLPSDVITELPLVFKDWEELV